MKCLILFLIISLALSSRLEAQTVSREILKDTSKYNFIIVDSRYQSQFAFWGRDYNQKIPFLATSLLYYIHSGVWMGASNFSFFNQAIPTQFGLSLGYFKEVTPRIDWHTSYSQFYVQSSSVPPPYNTQGYFQTTLGIEWGLLFSNFQAHVLINQRSDVFFTTYHSRYFVFNQLLWKKVKVSFEPKVSFTWGTHNFEYANGLVFAPGGGGVISQPGTAEGQGSKIQALNFDFVFPLKFAVGYFSIEPSWKYTLPMNANPIYSASGFGIYSIEGCYYIPIKR